MRTAIGLGLGTLLLAALPAAAMVPANMQRRNELRQVLRHQVFNRFDRLGPIDMVQRIEPNIWRVSSGRCYIDVRMVPQGRDNGLTPRPVEPRPQRMVCRR
jgi:hypothetical protein